MLSLKVQNFGDVTVLRCSGRITSGSDHDLREAIREQRTAETVVLDLAGVRTIDAAGLGALVDLRAYANAGGKQLKLANIGPRIEALLQLTQLNTAFHVCSLREMLELFCRTADPSRAADAITDVSSRPQTVDAA